MYRFYRSLTASCAPALRYLLQSRLKKGKEDPERISERQGVASKARPNGHVIWIHAASIGEAQSTLILVARLLAENPKLHILITTGTVTSAKLMGQKLPDRAIHQFYPLDHPDWTTLFLNHWKPDLILWLESELWPNMLTQVKERKIPAVLVNARLSKRSFQRWKNLKSLITPLLNSFNTILCQTDYDAERFIQLGAQNTIVTGNLKFSASPLPFDKSALGQLAALTTGRPIWLYASTHKGEEEMACRVHAILKERHPDLLTIIVPRHPDRRTEIAASCRKFKLNINFRGSELNPPKPEDDIYIADTLGELGLFYRLCPVAVIGRSFSDDGGGGHNPIEAAQLGCVVLHGPNVQNLQEIFDAMNSAGAVMRLQTEGDLIGILQKMLNDGDYCTTLQNKALAFVRTQTGIVETVLDEIKKVMPSNDL